MTLSRLMVAVLATGLALANGSQAVAQMTPYYQTPPTAAPQYAQYPAAAQPGYGQTSRPQITVPPVQPQTAPQAAPVAPNYRTAQYQLPNYQAPTPTARYAMNNDAPAAESVPAPQPTNQPTVAPSMPYSEGYSDTAPTQYQAPVESYPSSTVNNGAAHTNWEGYVQAPAAGGCENGACATGSYAASCDYGTFGGGGHSGILGGRLLNRCGRQWFFGTYGLYMTRDNPSYTRFATVVDEPAPGMPYYPAAHETVLSTRDIEPDWQWGAEVRLGSTFGAPCGSGRLGLRPYAWEVVYWGLAEDLNSATVLDLWGDADRMYGGVDYSGLNYDRDGAGMTHSDRPMNDYWDYSMPVDETNDVRVLGFRARNYFSAQNLEVNFLRFPVAGGCTTAACDPCGGCGPCAPPRFTVNGLCGFRFFRLNEDLQYAAMFTTVDGTGNPNTGEPTAYTGFPIDDDNNIFHDIGVDNDLYGFQIGSNANWLIGCRWSAFCDTTLGIFGNDACSYQTVYGGGGGTVTWDGSGNSVGVLSKKTDVSFLGELRTGIGYQVGCNCRLTAAYRVVAITGVALAGEQIPTVWSDHNYVQQSFDTNDSLVLHGLQSGIEWKY